MSIILEACQVSRRFGGVVAVNNLNLQIPQGNIFGLIGPNGAGKTTLLNIFSGLLKPGDGAIIFEGQHVEHLPPYAITKRGIARTYQNIRLFRTMSLVDNLIVGAHAVTQNTIFDQLLWLPRARREDRQIKEKALALLARVGLLDRANEPAANLSYGDQRRLELVRALASNPHLLLLDEPAAGMNNSETAELQDFLLNLKAEGLTILLIEHDMNLVMNVCDTIAVLNFGNLISVGSPQEVRGNPTVISAYLGAED